MRYAYAAWLPLSLASSFLFNGVASGQSDLSLEPFRPLPPPEVKAQPEVEVAKPVAAPIIHASATSVPVRPAGLQKLPPPEKQSASDNGSRPIELAPLLKPVSTSTALSPAPSPASTAQDVAPIPLDRLKKIDCNDFNTRVAPNLSLDAMLGPPPEPSALLTRSNFAPSSGGGGELLPFQRRELGPEGLMDWTPSGYAWQSPAFCYSPLYFEQPNFERYGQGKGKPFASTVSAARFVGHTLVLPISMACNPPWCKECTLGHHRPGDCAPIQRHHKP